MSDWAASTLADVAEIGAGNSAPQDERLFKDGVHPFIRTSDVGQIRFGSIATSADLLNEEGIQGLRLFPKGTILMPKSGASTFLNHRVEMAEDGYVSSHLATVHARPNLCDGRFLLYYLSTVRAQDLIQDHKYPSLTLGTIGEIPVPLPPLDEQRRIVVVLDQAFAALDRARANVEASLRDVGELFSTQLRRLLSGSKWPRRALSKVCAQVFAGGDVPTGRHSKEVSKEYQVPIYTNGEKNEGLYGYTDKPRVTSPSLTVSARGTIGYAVIRNSPYFPAIRLIVVIPDVSVLDLNYLYYAIKTIDIDHSGASIPQLTVPMIREFAIPVPPLDDQRDISTRLGSLQIEVSKLRSACALKLSEIAVLRQSLLQAAFSGQLT